MSLYQMYQLLILLGLMDGFENGYKLWRDRNLFNGDVLWCLEAYHLMAEAGGRVV